MPWLFSPANHSLTALSVCSTSALMGRHQTSRRGVVSGVRSRCDAQPSVTPAVLPDPVGANQDFRPLIRCELVLPEVRSDVPTECEAVDL